LAEKLVFSAEMKQPEEKDFYTVGELAKLLSYSERTIRDRIGRGEIKSVRLERKGSHRIPRGEVERLIKGEMLDEGSKEKTGLQKPLGSPHKGEFETAYPSVDAIVLATQLERRHKTWILHKWFGLDKGEIAEKLGISSERIWRDIEETEKEWAGKVEAKELTKALNVSWLMNRFLSCLRTPDSCHILSIGTELTESLWVEREPLFPELKKLLNNNFWTKFDDWKKTRVQYLKECVSFRDAVRQKVEQESQMKTTECWEKEGLHDTFWQRIYTHIFLKTEPRALDRLDKDYLQRLETTEFTVEANCLIVKGENCILAEGEPSQLDRVSEAYWSLVAGFTSASGPKQIWALWQELDKTEKFLNAQAEAVYKEIVPNWFRYRELEI